MYQDYLQKLNFGTTTDSINAMKDRALTAFSNPLEQQYEGLQMNIGKLAGDIAGIDNDKNDMIDKVTEGITSALGAGFESGGLFIGMRKFYDGIKNKAKTEGSTKDDMLDDVDSGKNPDIVSNEEVGRTGDPNTDKPNRTEYEGKSDEPDGPDPENAVSAPYEENTGNALTGEQQEALNDFENGVDVEEEGDAGEIVPRSVGGEIEMQDMSGTARNIGSDAEAMGDNLEGTLGDFVGNAKNTVSNIMSRSIGGQEIELQNMGSSISSKGLPQFQDVARSLGGQEIELQDMGQNITDTINNVTSSLGENVSGALEDISSNISGSVSDFFGNLTSSVATYGRNALSSLNNLFSGASQAVEGATEGISNAVGSVGDLVSSAVSGATSGGLNGAITGVTNALTNTAGKAATTVAEVGDTVADVGAGIGETAAEVAGTVAGVEAAGAASEAIPVVGQVIGTLLMIGGAIFGGVESGENEKNDEVKEQDEQAEAQDQVKEAEIKSQELTEQSKLTNQQFTGSNVISSISSLFGQGSTATAF